MKKILLSILTMGIVSVGAVYSTAAYFSDTEASAGNSFTSGTIDIAVDGENPWARTNPYVLANMMPGEIDSINFEVKNVGTNPANVWKDIEVMTHTNVPVSEPECAAETGIWTDTGNGTGTCTSNTPVADLENIIAYGLSVELYDGTNTLIWDQKLYAEDETLQAAYAAAGTNGLYLGMVPAGWTLRVSQDYRMDSSATNEYQGDSITFDINLYAEQIQGNLVLEDKDTSTWQVLLGNDRTGTLTYEVKNPTFDFTFTGRASLVNTAYVLAAGYDGSSNVDTQLGTGSTDASGDITITGDVELGKSLENVKVWLIPATAWSVDHVTDWGQMSNFLWETGLIDYTDTNL